MYSEASLASCALAIDSVVAGRYDDCIEEDMIGHYCKRYDHNLSGKKSVRGQIMCIIAHTCNYKTSTENYKPVATIRLFQYYCQKLTEENIEHVKPTSIH
jgi:hypothetical protein